ncbi:MAG: hypothetical protein V4721_16475 [Bacteroidota bacterium]
MSTQESEAAFYNMTLRQIAPHLKKWFEWYSVKHNCPFYEVYLVGRYKPDCDMDDPKSAIVELKHVKGGDISEALSTAKASTGSSEMTLLEQMFPLFKEHILKRAEEWNVSKYRVFLMVCYLVGKDIDNVDSIDLQFRCKVPGQPDLALRIE